MRPAIDGSAILITGASSGIGRELARQLAGRARALVLVARRAERLSALADELRGRHPALVVSVQPCDLAERPATDAMLAAAEATVGPVDILVNNAGLGDFRMYDLAPWSKVQQILSTNIDAVAYLTHRLLGPMLARGRGGILNISSGFGLQFLPGFAAYVGSKHFVTGFSEALHTEARAFGVVVSQVCPGPVATEFEDIAGHPPGRDFEGRMQTLLQISAERCVRWTLRAFGRGRALIIPGVLHNLLMLVSSATPRFIRRWLLSTQSRRIRRLQEAKAKAA